MAEASDRDEGGCAAESVEALRAALAAERARTREVEHRAKNSLQLITSVLQLLARRTPNEDTRAALKTLQHHVGAVAAVHREFMDAARPDRFDLSRFVREQAPSLAHSAGEGATLRLDLDEVEVDARDAPPFALILSELALNALKHGRPADGGAATATVGLRRTAEGVRLSVQDGGPGPAAVTAAGFGLTMVRLLAQQVGGALTLEDAQPGLRAVVTAP